MKVLAEAEFLTCCCREEASRDAEAPRTSAAAVRRWEQVVLLAARHGVAGLVLPTVESLAREGSAPLEAEAGLRRIAALHVARTARLRLALTEVLAAARQRGVKVMVLKGAALGTMLYQDPLLRPSQDIDLLCQETEYEGVRDTLLRLGYTTQDGLATVRRRASLETLFERHFQHPDGLVEVELHTDCIKLGVRPRHSEAIWGRAMAVEIDGEPALTLAPDDQVLVLSIHLHRHGFNRLIWFKDMDLLLRLYGPSLDWERICAEAGSEGATPSLWYTLSLLAAILHPPIPPEVLRVTRPPAIIRWALARIWPEAEVVNLRSKTRRRAVQFSVHESWRGTLPSLVLMGRRREKVGILLRRLLPG